MSAGGEEFVLHVEGAELRVLHEEMFLSQAEPAGVGAGGVRRRPGDQGPVDLEPPFYIINIYIYINKLIMNDKCMASNDVNWIQGKRPS